MHSLRELRRAVLALALSAVALQASAQPAARPFVGGGRSQDEILERIRNAAPLRFGQVGTSSVTLRMDFGDGVSAAYKPRTRTHRRGYLAEVAAYRVARALGMDNVPPAVGRSMNRLVMQNRFTSEAPEAWESIREQVMWDAPGVVRGAAIYWIPEMRPSELHVVAGLDAAASWLSIGGELPADRADMSRDLSTMLAFDYLIGNWDRFSGGNVTTDAAGRRLFVRDHNLAFHAPLRGALYERVRGHVERTERFSRSFVRALSALDRSRLEAALEEDPEFEASSLLSPRQMEDLLCRRRALLSYIGALVALHGAERVFAWP